MKFSIRKKLLFLIAVLSLALIIASVLISSRLYSDSLEQNMKGLCTETADSLRESLESDHIDFMIGYRDKIKAVYDQNRELLEEAAVREFESMDQKEEFLRTVVDRDDGVIVTIGDENMDEQMADYSMITATYSVDGKTVGKIGVIGPKRMKYGEVTSIMEYLTENLNSSFKLTDGSEMGAEIDIDVDVG